MGIKRRAHGEGNIRQRPDGRWEARINVGYNPDGTRRRKSVYGSTQAEVRQELNKLANKRDAGEVITTTRMAMLVGRTLSIALNYAVKEKIITSDPASGLSIPNSGDDKDLHKPLDSEEAKRFLKAAEEHRLWGLWVPLLGVGMRQGEALAVRRRDIDFKRITVRVRQGKTQSSRRTLSRPLFVMNALREHIAVGPFGVATIDGSKLKSARLAPRPYAVRIGGCGGVRGAEPPGRPERRPTNAERACFPVT